MTDNPLMTFSDALAAAVTRGGAATVMVNGRQRLPASGIAYAADLILTADHVVEYNEDIPVTLPNGERLAAAVVGRDPGSDLALLRLPQAAAEPGELAPEPAHIGQLVLALGRPAPQDVQASLGVLSAIGGPMRTGGGGLIESAYRTDTIPYPGFSGGPLVDAAGRILGLNTSGLARGASLTLPHKLAWGVAAALAEHGSVKRGYLGVRSQEVELPAAQQEVLGRGQTTGLLVVWLEPAGPAARGGLLVGDILVGINDQPVTDADDLLTRLAGAVVGRVVAVQALRGGALTTLQVEVGERR